MPAGRPLLPYLPFFVKDVYAFPSSGRFELKKNNGEFTQVAPGSIFHFSDGSYQEFGLQDSVMAQMSSKIPHMTSVSGSVTVEDENPNPAKV